MGNTVNIIDLKGKKVKLAPKYADLGAFWYNLNGERIAVSADTDQTDLLMIQKTEDNKVVAKGEDKGLMKKPGTWHEQIIVEDTSGEAAE